MAQALYGSDFQVEAVSGNDCKAQPHNKPVAGSGATAFSFSLFAADMSFEGSVACRLGFSVDNDINPNEKYLYRLTSAVPRTIFRSPIRLRVFIGAANYEPLPGRDAGGERAVWQPA